MKKMFIIIGIIGLLIFSGFSFVNSAALEKETIHSAIKISRPVIVEKEEYITVDFQDSTYFMTNPGEPMLPYITKNYVLPFGSKIDSVDVVFENIQEITISNYVKPAPEMIRAGSEIHSIQTNNFENTVYSSSEVYPAREFDFSAGSGLDGDDHVVFLTVYCYPVRYSPASNTLFYSENVDITVEYQTPSNPVVFNDEYDLVIISDSRFSNNLQPLITHKNNYGVRTFLKTTDEIIGHYDGRDDAEQIKYFIKDAIETWNAKYVLLIGDMDFMPMRIIDIDMWTLEGLPTDLYYADIYDQNGTFCSWDSDGDGKFGEYDRHSTDNDFVDFYADIKVGRIPCKNNLELKTVIGKIITYETQTYDAEWFNNAVLMGGDTFPDRNPYEGEVVTEEVSKQLTEFDITKLWTSTGNYNPFTINRAITQGAGFVSYSGHGYQNGFGTSPPNEEDRIEYWTPYSLGMLNKDKYTLIFFDACLTATIDHDYNGIKLPCIAWYLIRKPVGGAVATIGATRVAFTMVDNEGVHGGAGFMNVHFFKAYEPGVAYSQMLVSAQNDYIQQRPWPDAITLEEFNLLGDPSLKVGGYPSTQDLNVKIQSNLNNYEGNTVELKADSTGDNQPHTYKWDLDFDGQYDDGTGETVEYSWDNKGVYWVSVKVTDSKNNENIFTSTMIIEEKPDRPLLKTYNDYGYTFSAKPSDQINWDEIYYVFDWGDGTYSEILGPYKSDETAEATHSWSSSGTYNVKVKMLMINSQGYVDEETGWSDPYSVTKSKSSKYHISHPFFEKLFVFLSTFLKGLNMFIT